MPRCRFLMFLRTTSTIRPLTVIWCRSVLILILHNLQYLICLLIICQNIAYCVANFPLLDLVATPAILFGALDHGIQGDGKLLIVAKVIIQHAPGTGIQRRWIGRSTGRILHLVGEGDDTREVLLVFLRLRLALLDQGVEDLR